MRLVWIRGAPEEWAFFGVESPVCVRMMMLAPCSDPNMVRHRDSRCPNPHTPHSKYRGIDKIARLAGNASASPKGQGAAKC